MEMKRLYIAKISGEYREKNVLFCQEYTFNKTVCIYIFIIINYNKNYIQQRLVDFA